MNKPYILQRFELEGVTPLFVEGEKFKMDKCSAFGYMAFAPDANQRELIQRMENALNEQYGKKFKIIVAESREINAGKSVPEAILYEMSKYRSLPFSIIYVPMTEDGNLYSYFYDKRIPILSMVLFVPNEHKRYFDMRSEYLNYTMIHNANEWDALDRKVFELHNQCIPKEQWLK